MTCTANIISCDNEWHALLISSLVIRILLYSLSVRSILANYKTTGVFSELLYRLDHTNKSNFFSFKLILLLELSIAMLWLKLTCSVVLSIYNYVYYITSSLVINCGYDVIYISYFAINYDYYFLYEAYVTILCHQL